MATSLAAQNNANRFSLTSAGQKYKSKVSTGHDPSGGSRVEFVRLLFQTLEAATIPWPRSNTTPTCRSPPASFWKIPTSESCSQILLLSSIRTFVITSILMIRASPSCHFLNNTCRAPLSQKWTFPGSRIKNMDILGPLLSLHSLFFFFLIFVYLFSFARF